MTQLERVLYTAKVHTTERRDRGAAHSLEANLDWKWKILTCTGRSVANAISKRSSGTVRNCSNCKTELNPPPHGRQPIDRRLRIHSRLTFSQSLET